MKKIFAMMLIVAASLQMQAATLPSVKLKDVNGNTVSTAQIEQNDGNPVIISFFATWCKPCLRELKAIHEVYADWQEETGVKMYIVSVDQGQDINKVKPLVDGFGWDYEVLLDSNGDFKRAMNVQQIPYLLVLDGEGNIIYNHTGYTDGGEDEVYKLISK